MTPLMITCDKNEDGKKMKLLINSGAKMNELGYFDTTLLRVA